MPFLRPFRRTVTVVRTTTPIPRCRRCNTRMKTDTIVGFNRYIICPACGNVGCIRK